MGNKKKRKAWRSNSAKPFSVWRMGLPHFSYLPLPE